MNARHHLIAKLCCILFLVAACFMTSASAFAQNSSLGQAVSLSKSAMEDYDFFELESADTKLIQAVQIIENLGVTDPSVANIYIAQGIVSYGRFKDSAPAIADERAFSAFLKALTLNKDVAIPNDYRSNEIEEIFNRAKETIASAPASSAIALAAAKPTIEHTAATASNRCQGIDIRATVPAHPDIYRVYVYYAPDDQRGYTSIEMRPELEASDILTAVIPALDTRGEKVSYYIEAQNRLGEVIVTSGTAQVPYTVMLSGSCDGLTREELDESFGDPLFQLSVMVGTGLGIVGGETNNCLTSDQKSCSKMPANGGGALQHVVVKTGVALLPVHIRASGVFNLPSNVQLGVYVRGQLANIVATHNARKDLTNPATYNIMVGATLRYLVLHQQPYRFYIGVEFGWGGSNATVDLGKQYDHYKDIYLFDGPFHVAPELGFLWTFHKNVGLAVELAVPIHFPNKPAVHFDLSVGPYFQF